MSAVPPTRLWGRVRLKVYALTLVALLLVAAGIAVAAYNRAFTASVPVSLHASRAGLQMHPGNRVKLRGVDLGYVHEVALDRRGPGVTIVLYLDPALSRQVPSNVEVSLNQLTAFGNKTVQLNFPSAPSARKLHAGSVITADHVTTEVNNVFDQLMSVITEIRPAKLNATLGAFAEALQGNGDRLGATLSSADDYLARFNGNLPALRDDFRVTAGFANVYARATPDLANLLSNAGVTSATIADPRTDLAGALHGAARFGGETDDFFAVNADPLTGMLRSLRPTTTLLHQYAPELTCFIDGEAQNYRQLNKNAFSRLGVSLEVAPAPGSAGTYQYPGDLPTVGPGAQPGPNCRGLPLVDQRTYQGTDYSTDPPGLRGRSNSPLQLSRRPAVVQMFGPDALPAAARGGS